MISIRTKHIRNNVIPLTGILAILLSVVLFSTSCKKNNNFDDTPQINLINYKKLTKANGIDTMIYIKMSFTDGDGDIGLDAGDTFSPYEPKGPNYYNLILKFYEMNKGVKKEIKKIMKPNGDSIPLNLSERIRNITPEEKNKSIKGEIETAVYFNIINPLSDTISYDIYIMDRALHKSNIISTPNIVIKRK
ncbi:MAG: hypothetical protein Q8880_04210 [Bacteroidota bacterium]|nr:hypothetical protein [Bacteroidota bacterium]